MTNPSRPIPVPTAETSPFWEAAKQGGLRLARCADCGHLPYPPRAHCPECLGESLVWEEVSGAARLRGWTEVHINALPGRDGPLMIVEAELVSAPGKVIVALCEDRAVQSLPPDAPLDIFLAADPNGWSYPEARAAEGEAP